MPDRERQRRQLPGQTFARPRDEADGQIGQLRATQLHVEHLEAANANLDARRRASEADQAHLRLAIEAANLYTWELDPASDEVRLSSNVAAVLGVTPSTRLAENLSLIHPDDRDEFERQVTRAWRGEAPLRMDVRFVHPEAGDDIWLRVQGHAIPASDAPGAPLRLVGVAQNITEQKRREQNAAFLADLGDDFARLSSVEAIMHAAGEKLYRFFGLSRVAFANVDEAADTVTIVYDKHAPGLLSGLGDQRISDVLSDDSLRELRAGRVVVVDDAITDPRITAKAEVFAGFGVRSLLVAPFVSEGRWRFLIAIYKAVPYTWRVDEIKLIEEIAPRIHLYLERARVEAALRAGEERYRTLFESIDEGFCVIEVLFDSDGTAVDYRFLEVNPAFERQTGLREATGKTARELVPNLESHWFEIYGRVATTGEPVRFVNEARPMDGRWFDVNAFRLGGPESRTVAILFTDITARKRAEADIERLAAIVESSHDAILRCELDGTVIDWNHGAEDLYGYTAAEIVGKSVMVLVPPDRVDELTGFLERLKRGEDIPPLETVRLRKDGTPVEIEVRPSAVRDVTGQIVGIGAIARDVTVRKRLERAQEDFLAMASHDLRSPVTVLRGRAQLMRRRKTYDEAALDAILEQSRRIERLADDLREVVTIETGGIDLRRTPVDLSELARDAAERIKTQARLAPHRLRVVAPASPVVGQWDRDRLGQVLDNLLGNAVKYCAKGGEITISVTPGDGAAQLSVTDQGPGIPADALPRLFERFYRADGTGATSGLGLGLYITRMLVEAHGGRIAAASTLGEGTTFTVVLPIESESEPERPVSART